MKQALIAFVLASAIATGALADSLTVTVTGASSSAGKIIVSVWKTSGGFAAFDVKKAAISKPSAIVGGAATVTFDNLPAGNYAVTAFHDEDGNGKVKTNLLGIPSEGVGVSRNPGGMPNFNKSVLAVSGQTKTAISLRYIGR